jgi:superfamily II DNA/RNA helicase
MTKFSDLALDPRVLKAVAEAGYETPTPIQAGAIPEALKGRDVLGIAQTGTGKTASFTLPMITLLGQGRARARMPRSLVLAPTRELAAQVAENFETYAKHTKLTKALLIGGVAFGEQDKLIDRGVDVLIATPGRLLDHFERGKLLLTGVQIMVVDEADRMLDMGFIPDIERIFQLTPFTRQTMFYSATMAPEIERITSTFLTNPARIEVARQATASATIEQQLIQFTPTKKERSFAEKRAVLRSLIKSEGETCTNAIVFCNRKIDVDVVYKSLKAHGFSVGAIHGDLDQSQRTKTLETFREGSLQILCASDVAARGLDIPTVSHVFNFDVPTHPEDYVHRIGRTGRAGRLGKAYTIATPNDAKYLAAIQSLVKMDIPLGVMPEGALNEVADRPDRAARSDRPERSSRSRDEGRGPRTREGRGGDRPVKPHGEMASMEPLQVVETTTSELVVDAAPMPKPERREPQKRNAPRSEPRRDDRRGERTERAPQDRAPQDRSNQDRNQVMGLGDHVPDFLQRSFALKPRLAEPATMDEPTDERPMTGTEASDE